MRFKDFFHILNPNRTNAAAVHRFFKKHSSLASMAVERSSHPTHLETIVEWAVNEGHTELAVWGGDGTLSRVVNALYDLNALDKVTVTLVPVGTCNDLARKLNLPRWKKWVEQALQVEGKERRLDIGLLLTPLNHRTFINNAGFGRVSSALRRKSNPIKDIFSFTPKQLDLEWELNGARHFETRLILLGVVCNAPYFNRAMHFAKDVEPNDGVLNAFLENPHSKKGLFLKFLKSRLGGALSSSHTLRIDARTLSITSDSDLFPQVDGEPVSSSAVRSISFSMLPARLRFFQLEKFN